MALTPVTAHWKFDESSGNATDSSGNGYTLTNNNTVGYTPGGKLNNCADLGSANINKYFSRADSTGIPNGNSSFSISTYVNISTQPTSGQVQDFVRITTTNKLIILRYGNDGSPYLSVIVAGTTFAIVRLNTTLTNGVLYHVALTYNGSVNTGYLNSVNIGTATDTSLGSYTPLTTIGAYDAIPNNVLKGKMDETTIFPYTLTSDEVSQLFNSGAGKAYPWTASAPTLGYYPMINLLGQGQIW